MGRRGRRDHAWSKPDSADHAASAMRRAGGSHAKRSHGSAADDVEWTVDIELVELSARSTWLGPLATPFHSSNGVCYNMDDPSDRLQLARDIWRLPLDNSINAMYAANAALVAVLREQLRNIVTDCEALGVKTSSVLFSMHPGPLLPPKCTHPTPEPPSQPFPTLTVHQRHQRAYRSLYWNPTGIVVRVRCSGPNVLVQAR